MSQQLTIEIIKSGKVQALCYSRWSGYVSIAIERVKKLLPYIDSIQQENPLKYSIRLLEKLGTGVDDGSWYKNEKELLQKLPDFKDFEFNPLKQDDDMVIWATENTVNDRVCFHRIFIDCDNKKIKLHIFIPVKADEIIEDTIYPRHRQIIETNKPPIRWMTFDEFFDFSDFYKRNLDAHRSFDLFYYNQGKGCEYFICEEP